MWIHSIVDLYHWSQRINVYFLQFVGEFITCCENHSNLHQHKFQIHLHKCQPRIKCSYHQLLTNILYKVTTMWWQMSVSMEYWSSIGDSWKSYFYAYIKLPKHKNFSLLIFMSCNNKNVLWRSILFVGF